MLRFIGLILLAVAAPVFSQDYVEPDLEQIQSAKDNVLKALEQGAGLLNDKQFKKDLSENRSKIGVINNYKVPKINGEEFIGEWDKDLYMKGVFDPSSRPMPDSYKNYAPIVLASLSMPEGYLKDLVRDFGKINSSIAIKGLLNDSFDETFQRIREIVGESGFEYGNIVLDPTLFQRFNVESVPAFILPLEAIEACSEDVCNAPRHVMAQGSMTLRNFLETVERNTNIDEAKKEAEKWLDGLNQ